jgi:hypothetical protein
MVALLKMPENVIPLNPADRRVFPRREIHAEVESRRLDHSLSALRQPRLKLSLHDLSLGGLAASVDHPLVAGERLNVFFPPAESRGGWNAVGRVLRCHPSATGYKIAVAFDPLPAAA